MEHGELILFFFAIAFLYSSVGFGGGSSYLALLAVYQLPYQELRLTALICNVIVVTGATSIYIRNKQTNWKKIIPITLCSIPFAFLGGMLKINQSTFFMLLGFTLVLAAILLWIGSQAAESFDPESPTQDNPVRNSLLGGGIGFLSGMVGIGGGIFLSPLLNLMRWDTAKKIAATASVFILVNSLSGISGQLVHLSDSINLQRILLLCAAVLVGGQLGTRTALKWNPLLIKRVTALLVLAAGINVLIKYW